MSSGATLNQRLQMLHGIRTIFFTENAERQITTGEKL